MEQSVRRSADSFLKSMTRTMKRIAVAIAVATAAALFTYAEHLRTHGHHSDFGVVWFGARSLLHGINPYPLVGPGLAFDWDFQLNYPATAMAAVLPLGLLPELAGTLIFVWLSAALLAYALTENGWERLWILPSAAFIVAARSAQWSPLYSAAYLLTPLAWMVSAKPTLGAVVIAAVPSRPRIRFAVVGSAALLLISLALLPTWPMEWIRVVRPNEFSPAITWFGGPFILLSILRWKLPEARLLLAMGLIPTTASWYEALPLLLIGRTKRECQVLSLVSSVGYIAQGPLFSNQEFGDIPRTRALMLAFCYLPAVLVVLRHPSTPERAQAR